MAMMAMASSSSSSSFLPASSAAASLHRLHLHLFFMRRRCTSLVCSPNPSPKYNTFLKPTSKYNPYPFFCLSADVVYGSFGSQFRHRPRLFSFAISNSNSNPVASDTVSLGCDDDNLPLKLAKIVHLFQMVPDPRAKYEQLLHYGKKLEPLPKEFQTLENKVNGCVSQVWVRAFLDQDQKVFFQADSDSLLTKGLAALLVEGLSGCPPSEILCISPNFVHLLGLKQSLTPSRSNGFLNMLKLMQKKTLELAMEGAKLSNDVVVGSYGIGDQGDAVQAVSSTTNTSGDTEDSSSSSATRGASSGDSGSGSEHDSIVPTRQGRMRQKLESGLVPTLLEIEDVSYQHAGHSGVERGASETHFNVKVVSSKFEGKSLVKRHRLIYDLLQEELQSGLHALSIVAKTPAEVEKAGV